MWKNGQKGFLILALIAAALIAASPANAVDFAISGQIAADPLDLFRITPAVNNLGIDASIRQFLGHDAESKHEQQANDDTNNRKH